MTSTFRRRRSIPAELVVGALFLAAGCGSRSGLPLPGNAEGGAAGAGGVTAAVCFAPGDPVPVRPTGAACAFEGNPTFGVLLVTGGWLYGVDGTGVATGLFDFDPHWPFEPAVSGTQVVESRGGYVGAAMAVTPKGDSQPKQAAVQLLLAHSNGTVLFHSTRTVPYKNFLDLRVHGNENGVFAFWTQTADRNELELVGAHGEHFGPIVDAIPIADPDRDGRIPIRRGQDHYWLDPCRNTEKRILAEGIGEYTSVGGIGERLAWVDPSSSTAALETAATLQELPLPLAPKVGLFRTHPAGWILASTSASPWSFASANVASGNVHAIDIAIYPSLFRFGSFASFTSFDSNSNELGLASDGGIFLGLRDSSLGGLYTSNDGGSWNQVGFPVGKVLRLQAIECAGTFLIAGTPMGLTTDDWAPPPPGVNRIDYQQTQLVRPPVGTSTVLAQATIGTGFTRSYSLSADGGCAGTLLGETLEITSAITLEKHLITLPTFTPVYGAWTFVPGPTPSLGMN